MESNIKRRNNFFRVLLLFILWSDTCVWTVRPGGEFQPFTISPVDDWSIFISNLQSIRNQTLEVISYNDTIYKTPDLLWAQSAYVFPQTLMWDRYLWDPEIGWTVDKFLEDLNTRYGGIDAVLLWPTYPNIGVDDRNQFDIFRSSPGGGLNGLLNLTSQFLSRGIHVMLPYHPWDLGTRDEGTSDEVAVASLLQQTQVSGINGDTMQGVPADFLKAAQHLGFNIALQTEEDFPDTDCSYLSSNVLTWEEFWVWFPSVPSFSSYRWLEARHMSNIVDRWAHNHSFELQTALFNGAGFVSWENVWGYWNGLTDFDAESLRRSAAILRFFSEPFFHSPDWLPYFPTLHHTIVASYWPSVNSSDVLWVFVNYGGVDFSGPVLNVTSEFLPDTNVSFYQFFDVYHGEPITPLSINNSSASFSLDIEALGYGVILATQYPSSSLLQFLKTMNSLTNIPLSSYSNVWTPLQQEFFPRNATPLATSTPAGMVYIPGNETYLFEVAGIEIERPPDSNIGIDVQYPWETEPTLNHSQTLAITSFYIDVFPVTNQDYSDYLQVTNYTPSDPLNWLRDWSNGTYPPGGENQPVTWIGIEEAAAYCAFYNKRLPHEWEWQFAAQGGDNANLFPWGGDTFISANVPIRDFGRSMRGPDNVDAHPQGASPNGVQDLVGNIWQWTDEVQDDHTRYAIVRGGNNYFPQTYWDENWYFPHTYQLNQHGKYFLISPSMDRSGGIGFRCVVDAGESL